jgi:hypothetical protein
MNIDKITDYMRKAVNNLGGGVILHNGVLENRPYILLDAAMVYADTGEAMPPIAIQYPDSLPSFVLNNKRYMSSLMRSIGTVAPRGDVRDCEYIRALVKNEVEV